MFKRGLTLLFTFWAFIFYVQVGIQAQTATVGFEYRANLIMLEVTINGVPQKLILDTGASTTVIDDKTAEELNLERSGQIDAVVAGTQIRASMVLIDSIGINGMARDSFLCAAANIGNIKVLVGEDVSGLLGCDFLGKFKVSIDFRAKFIAFDSYEKTPDDTIAIIGDTCWIPEFGRVIKPGPSWMFSTEAPLHQIKLILYNTEVTGTAQIQDHELRGIPLQSAAPYLEQSLKGQLKNYEKIGDAAGQLGEKDIYLLEYKGWDQGENLRFKHIFVKVRDSLFSINCFAPISQFAPLEDDFEKLINRIRFVDDQAR